MMNQRFETIGRTGAGLLAILAGLIAVVSAFVLVPAALNAQDTQRDSDTRLAPFLGCWEVVGGTGQVVCVEPGEVPTDLTFRMADGEGAAPETIHVDGTWRPAEYEGCQGTESASFSEDGRRVYLDAQLTCDGGIEQRSTGLLTLVAADEWVEIRSLSQGDDEVVWTQRYVEATPRALQAAGTKDPVSPWMRLARRQAAQAPTVPTVTEAAQAVHGQVVAAWIVESGVQMNADGADLLAMAESGVGEEVIDVVVAASNPRYFNLGATGPARQDPQARPRTFAGTGLGFAPFGLRNRGFGWGRFGSAFGWGWSPFGNPFWYGADPFFFGGGGWGGWGGGWGWGGGGFFTPIVVGVDRRDSGDFRAIAGQGYRRTGGSSAAPAGYQGSRSGSSRPASTRTARPRSGGSTSARPARSVTPPKSSTRSGGGSRTARPRTTRRGGGGSF